MARRDPFEKILAQQTPADLDPAVFGDPVALKTAWHPARFGGANFRTSGLVERSPMRMEFRPALQVSLFAGFFMVASLALTFFFVADGWDDLVAFERALVLGALGAFFLAGLGIFIYSRRPIVFDKEAGYFYQRWKPPQPFDSKSMLRAALIRDIHALQIVRELVRGKSTYYSYELNLVLRDGQRINVVDHGKLPRLREDAVRLAKWLGCKVWDATAVTAEPKIPWL